MGENTKKLTEMAFCSGCAAKLRAEVLGDVINPFGALFSQAEYPDLLIGLEKADDAAVMKLDEDRALVFTTDFFPPPVDDPYDYGAIAAANSLSDIFAMGGKPLMALNITALPADLPQATIAEIFRGGAEKAKEAGCAIVGGHTIRDNEPKYGLAVVGMADPRRLLYKGHLHVGDQLILTKPLGFGLILTAQKGGVCTPEDLAYTVGWMKTLNKAASETALDLGCEAGTDVTGFSLIGHSWEMIRNDCLGIRYSYGKIPMVQNYETYMRMGLFPDGAQENYNFYHEHVRFDPAIDELHQMMLFDPQTSGGLLLGVPADRVDAFLSRCDAARVIGEVTDTPGIVVEA